MTNAFNGLPILARTKDAIYVRLPESVQAESAFAGAKCTCGHCDGSGKWDTLVIPVQGTRHNDSTYTVHMPDSSIAGFVAYIKKAGKAA